MPPKNRRGWHPVALIDFTIDELWSSFKTNQSPCRRCCFFLFFFSDGAELQFLLYCLYSSFRACLCYITKACFSVLNFILLLLRVPCYAIYGFFIDHPICLEVHRNPLIRKIASSHSPIHWKYWVPLVSFLSSSSDQVSKLSDTEF